MSHGTELQEVVDECDESVIFDAYMARHHIASGANLTVTSDAIAADIAAYLAPRIEGKTVIEIGGGLGILALYLGEYAKRVYCIEANPMWSAVFIAELLQHKPPHVSYLFGAAQEFQEMLHGDVAVICTHSGLSSMTTVAATFAPVVIDVYGEIIAQAPAQFDPLARQLRASS